uniref:Uncharacterized protein n=1 Tax=Oryza glumipatula TaxID=40148 RepID=A0A0D9YFV3_9ORYZ
MAPLASFGLRAADPQMPHRHIVSTRRRCLVRIHIVCTKMTEVVARIHSQGIPEGMIPIVGHTVFKASRLSIVRLYLGTARILVKLDEN